MAQCPCGSKQDYSNCCGTYIDGGQAAPTPEALMRSRYSAYSMARVDYIEKTMRGKPLIGFNTIEAKRWAKKVRWLDLSIVNTSIKSGTIGYVEFIARFIEGNKLKSIHETSEFFAEGGNWYYVDGNLTPTNAIVLQRNMPCPCGSKRKFKNCHAN